VYIVCVSVCVCVCVYIYIYLCGNSCVSIGKCAKIVFLIVACLEQNNLVVIVGVPTEI